MNGLNETEMLRDFEAEFGKDDFEEIEEEKFEEEIERKREALSNLRIFNESIEDSLNAYFELAAKHFTSKQAKSIKEEAFYFNGRNELKRFFEEYFKLKGKIEDLHIGVVEEMSGSRPYYEVCRKKYYLKRPEEFFS